ncbi:MAG: hypothetical protein ABJL57_01345 [Hyphomonas sp.]|uniref:hypothetical protein n=1 Tax=Hyphomonas sp. TaxID=87 RepID=UPI0032677797
MSAQNDILNLQRAQLRHDESYHQDILVLDTARRAKHMTLHNAKYSGRFVAAIEDGDKSLFARTLTDAFIISLATANIFAHDLRYELPPESKESSTLQDLGILLAESSNEKPSFLRSYSGLAGEMAKACESLDHLEDYPFRTKLTKCNAGIFRAVLIEASVRQIDMAAFYNERIADVEARSPRRLFQ